MYTTALHEAIDLACDKPARDARATYLRCVTLVTTVVKQFIRDFLVGELPACTATQRFG